METFFNNNPVVLGIATLVALAIGIISLMFGLTDKIETKWKILFWSIYAVIVVPLIYVSILIWYVYIIAVVLFLCFFSFILIRKIRTKPTKYKRFEDIKQDNIKYGYVVYKPFFWNDMTHKGIGYDVLKEILRPLNINIDTTDNNNYHSSNWSKIFKELEDEKIDIIIIPLFETRRRLNKYNVTFCTPLFYSDIGIYAKNKDLPDKKFLFSEAIEFIKERNWKGKYLKREISHSLMEKHKLPRKAIKPTVAEFTEDAYFQSIISEIKNGKTNFTFMEVFKAKTIIKGQNTSAVINILKDKELLYPVSFVVRKKDTVLKNYINLRIIELAMEQVTDNNGEQISKLKQIIKTAAVEGGILENEFDNNFVWKKFD